MFAAFVAGGAANLGERRTAAYKALPAQRKDKVVAYFRTGMESGTDPKALKLRTFRIMTIFETADDIQVTAKKYRETGKLDHATNQKLTALWDDCLITLPTAAGLFDRAELDRIDKLWNSVLDDNIANLDADTARLKEKNARSEKRIKELQELNAIFESIRKTL